MQTVWEQLLLQYYKANYLTFSKEKTGGGEGGGDGSVNMIILKSSKPMTTRKRNACNSMQQKKLHAPQESSCAPACFSQELQDLDFLPV